jgi:1-aminocyclopropane-1-carboxylate deaminase/D-cysteine desulfhydrase-like pyridoxal-dependent ACC family enzyme
MNSRIHRLNTFDAPGVIAYVKREDELSFGISGSKLRKYSSLIPYLIEQNIKEVVLAGSASSNHILSIAQLLKENKIKITLFLGGRRPDKPVGNFIFTSLIIAPEDMHWVARGEEDSAAQAYAAARSQEKKSIFYIPSGARMKEAIPGALSLIHDLEKNERELGITFDHVFIDSGTGTTAVTAILGSALLKKHTHFHVIQMAGTSHEFKMLIEDFRSALPPIHSPLRYSLYQPLTARSFGSTNASVWKCVVHMARHEGILVDPIYNAKLFSEGKRLLQQGKIQGNVLFIHSGGGFALAGFMENLGNILTKEVRCTHDKK